MYRETNEALFSKINALRFLAILGVLFIHAENTMQFSDLAITFGYPVEREAIGAFEWAVPLFFLLSSYLFFRDFRWNQLLPKWSRRAHSLLIPYLVWNTIYFALFALLPRLPLLAPYINSAPAPLTLSTVLTAVFLHQYAGFLWFCKALILLTLLAPLFYLLFSRRYLAEAALAVLFVFECFSPFDLPAVLSLNWRFVFFYGFGAYVGLRFPDAPRLTPPKFVRILLLCALPFVVALNVRYDSELYSLVFIVLLWFGLDAGVMRPYAAYQTSFFLYLTHILAFSLIKKFEFALLPHTEAFMLVSYFTVPLIAAALLVPLALFVKRIAPKTYAFLFGGR
jgi:peptidoglycan/LPS O-acetylase OafA/YrhL